MGGTAASVIPVREKDDLKKPLLWVPFHGASFFHRLLGLTLDVIQKSSARHNSSAREIVFYIDKNR